ncbi:MAG: hypothetical protein EXR79_15170 [Myxococcales bacterium]|nr:hypothetical protein [Myxococcales bacterium]
MLRRLVFGFHLERHTLPTPPVVRIWVDADGNQRLDDGEEVAPLHQDGLSWFGAFVLPADTLPRLGFLVRYQAEVGVRWTLDVALDAPEPTQLYGDSDIVRDAAGRIIGWVTV